MILVNFGHTQPGTRAVTRACDAHEQPTRACALSVLGAGFARASTQVDTRVCGRPYRRVGEPHSRVTPVGEYFLFCLKYPDLFQFSP